MRAPSTHIYCVPRLLPNQYPRLRSPSDSQLCAVSALIERGGVRVDVERSPVGRRSNDAMRRYFATVTKER